jgi:hypothetical protein
MDGLVLFILALLLQSHSPTNAPKRITICTGILTIYTNFNAKAPSSRRLKLKVKAQTRQFRKTDVNYT